MARRLPASSALGSSAGSDDGLTKRQDEAVTLPPVLNADDAHVSPDTAPDAPKGAAHRRVRSLAAAGQARIANSWLRLGSCAIVAAVSVSILGDFWPAYWFFGLVAVDPDIDVQELRLTLIRDHSVGVISIPEINALRLAFCSTRAEDMPELIRRIQLATSSL